MRFRFEQVKKNEFLWEEKLEGLQEKIGYFFKTADLLREAMTHSSFRHENGLDWDNERLEFVGDAVLQLLVTEKLAATYPLAGEGELTRRRSFLVCEETLLLFERHLRLFDYLRIGKGLEKQPDRGTQSIRADAVEALLGAIYLDGGLPEARLFFISELLPHAGLFSSEPSINPKSALQEQLQRSDKSLPEYILLEKTGQEDAPNFVVGIMIQGKIIATGTGHSKKEAEFTAARSALEALL
jgi:ribonuclease-3